MIWLIFSLVLVLDIDLMLKYSCSCAFLEKQLMVSIARIKPSCHDLELLHDNLIFDRLIAQVSTFCASIWSKICISLRTFVENGHNERVHCFFWTLCGDFHAKFRGGIVENCDYESYFLYASKKIFYGFIPSIKLLCLVSYKFEFPHEEQTILIVEEFLKTLKKMNGSLKVFKAHPCDLIKTTFGNGVFELNLKNFVEEHLVYSIISIDLLFKDETLNESIVQNTKSCVKIEKQCLGATLLYSLTFMEFLDELIFKRESKVLQVLMLNQECSSLNNVLKLFWKNLLQNFLFYHLPFKEIFWKHDLEKEQVSTSKDFNGSYWWTRSVSLKFHSLELLIKQLRKFAKIL
ncbi:hypothetical protein M9H77_08087 [Catharanthus roseus]|uniref:Uncharacterized protein n=1 Tax=Catharanthus roseus TaxID=4058 RepID=A0ACC0BWQ6_CATRO|nr:hypothetical protein M9H77_08087 [Catharanthus roseus]